jgi:hypothetical protein
MMGFAAMLMSASLACAVIAAVPRTATLRADSGRKSLKQFGLSLVRTGEGFVQRLLDRRFRQGRVGGLLRCHVDVFKHRSDAEADWAVR